MSLSKQNTHKRTVQTVRGSNNTRHERNRMRGEVTIINTVFSVLFSWWQSSWCVVLTNLLDVFKNEDSDEVHRFLLTHRVNGSPEGVQRTNTHDDFHDGMVVHSRGEEGAVWKCGFLNTTRFGPDVVLTTLCCHEDGLVNLRIIKEVHRKTRRHNRFDPLHVHLLSFPDLLEWTCDPIVRQARPFPKVFHVDDIVSLPTFQWSLNHLSDLYLVVIVPPFHFLDNLSMALNVLRRWFALLHLLRNASQAQVVLDAGFPGTGKFLCHPSATDSRPWAYFSEYDWSPFLLLVYCSPLGRAAPVCDPSPHLTKTFLCLYSVFQSVFFMRVCFFWRKKNSFGLREGVSH